MTECLRPPSFVRGSPSPSRDDVWEVVGSSEGVPHDGIGALTGRESDSLISESLCPWRKGPGRAHLEGSTCKPGQKSC